MSADDRVIGVADTVGAGGVFTDPVWRVQVDLTPLEQDLLRSWWVRRLGFVVHAGAAAISSTQSYTRLEHSLGLLALVAHFRPDDQLARAAALVHDVGHLPLSHTFEGVAGLDHHRLGAERIEDLRETFAAHGFDGFDVISIVEGRQPSALRGEIATLKLDHLESWVRSGHAHGRTREAPPLTLSRLRLVDGAVDTDAVTASYLVDLGVGEARSQTSAPNVIVTGVVRHLAQMLLGELSEDQRLTVAAMTDHELWALLLSHPATGAMADGLRRNPTAWTLVPLEGSDEPDRAGDVRHTVTRLYLDLPLVDGQPYAGDNAEHADLPSLPWRCLIRPPTSSDHA